jgi:hypothetical protein
LATVVGAEAAGAAPAGVDATDDLIGACLAMSVGATNPGAGIASTCCVTMTWGAATGIAVLRMNKSTPNMTANKSAAAAVAARRNG